jgi:hypothetical protein
MPTMEKPPTIPDALANKPSFGTGCFTLVGFGIVIAFLAGIVTGITVTLTDAINPWSVFALTFGLAARLFLWTVKNGMKDHLSSESLCEHDRNVLGEQILAHRILRRVIDAEIIASLVLGICSIYFTGR